MPSEQGSSPIQVLASALPDVPHPELATRWPRYFARMLDLSVSMLIAGSLVGVFAGLFAPEVFERGGMLSNDIVVFLILLPVMMCIDALLYGIFGNSPGKAICGLKVLNLDSTRVPFGTYLLRNLHVWAIGLGFGLPGISLWTLIVAARRAGRGELQPWDVHTTTRSFDLADSLWRVVLGALLIVGLYVGIMALGQIAA